MSDPARHGHSEGWLHQKLGTLRTVTAVASQGLLLQRHLHGQQVAARSAASQPWQRPG